MGPGSHTTWTGRSGERLGEAAAALPDLDDDGLPELAVAGVGSVYLLSTPSSGGSVEAISGYGRVDLEETGRRTLSSVVDANGDGAPQLIVGMPDALELAGMVCLFEAGAGRGGGGAGLPVVGGRALSRVGLPRRDER